MFHELSKPSILTDECTVEDDPTDVVAGNQHWGHATSTDLYTWINQPIALWPTNEFTFIFTGSAVVDTNNTSGFFPDQDNGVVAIFTLAQVIDGVGGLQAQGIAYSNDGGYSFNMYSGNPVLNINSTQFRDPKVCREYSEYRDWIDSVSLLRSSGTRALRNGLWPSPMRLTSPLVSSHHPI